ncbi:hypothetical protein K490DRAFT_41709 [Saccharata proteae CBS 121410]|uniref:Aminodeoxychorismate lyase n=1 Tax=Saccharata proteae CBS 121410 TaxID=1314787 RepID=A0A9P4HWM6_9PEZI|nr:hypothetical protein K490DRAFT_41709 [Saccharata proteae CBS 121410]
MSHPDSSFSLFTSLRYDPLLLTSTENSSPVFSFTSPSPFYMLRYHRDRMLEAAQHFEWTSVVQKLSEGSSLEQLLLQEISAWRETNKSEDKPLKVRILFNRNADMHVECTPTPSQPLSTLYPTNLDIPPAETNPFTPSPLTGGALTLGPTDTLPASSSSIPPDDWLLTLDTSPTPSGPHTLLKTTQRSHYDAARSRSLPAPDVPKQNRIHEVLLWSECGEITEGSFTSVYLYRGGRWVTPPVGLPDNVNMGDDAPSDEGELRETFAGRWGHSLRSEKVTVGRGGQRGTTRRWALKAGLCMEEPVHRETVHVGERLWVSNGVRGFRVGTVVERAS